MRVTVWSDYLCPWCYLGRDRTALMVDLGVEVTPLAYELHPEIPPEQRGTYEGVMHPAIIGHLQKLGINTLELMPVMYERFHDWHRRMGLDRSPLDHFSCC